MAFGAPFRRRRYCRSVIGSSAWGEQAGSLRFPVVEYAASCAKVQGLYREKVENAEQNPVAVLTRIAAPTSSRF